MTKYLKDPRDKDEVTQAVADIMADGEAEYSEYLHSRIKKVHHDVIRRARVRLDFVSCLLFRVFWA